MNSLDTSVNSLPGGELEPWIVADDSAGTLCMWRIEKLEADAIALFSSPDRAREYTDSLPNPSSHKIRQLPQVELLKLLLQSYQSEIRHAVLDPNSETARQLFQIKDLLQAARSQLRGRATENTEGDS